MKEKWVLLFIFAVPLIIYFDFSRGDCVPDIFTVSTVKHCGEPGAAASYAIGVFIVGILVYWGAKRRKR